MENQPQRHTNSFQKGQVKDVDQLQLSNQSYLHSFNGRVIFNEDGTYAWENANGTKFAFTLSGNYGKQGSTSYVPIGGWQINGKLLIFSTNGTNSEMGLVYQPQFGDYSYQTIFNDLYDPYGDLLGFSERHQMRDCQCVVETDKIERAYFNDDYNEPRVFNVLLGLQEVSPEFISGDYLPIGGAFPGNVYPSFYSVHGMAQMIDLTWGKLKFSRNIAGQLLSGEYQYAYRLIHQTGYASPWSPLSPFILLTTDTVSNNWTKYQMQQSGAATDKGIELELKYIDQRFQEVEVAALYWKTNTTPDSATIIYRGVITGSTMTIAHQLPGSTIAVDGLVQRYTEIIAAKTGSMKDNTYHLANIQVNRNLEIDTTSIQVRPIVKPMLSDETTYSSLLNTNAPPFTNQQPKINAITENLADGLPEVYSIYNDYINYKGTQWAALFKGNFGGETYPYAFVLFDKKGQPFFAQHISDFTMPERYSNQWVDRRLINGVDVTTTGTTGSVGDFKHTSNTAGTQIIDGGGVYQPIYNIDEDGGNAWYLNVLGVTFSGIDLTDILYDVQGNLQVSGFSIVRTDRIKTILGQGIVLSATESRNLDDTQNQFFETGTMFNGFIQSNGRPYNGAPPAAYSSFNTNYVGRTPLNYGPLLLPNVNQGLYNNPVASARPNMSFFACPDYLIDNNVISDSVSGDNIKIVGVSSKAYGTPTPDGQTPINLQYESYFQKGYRTVIDNYPAVFSEYNSASGLYDLVNMGDQIDVESIFPNIESGDVVFGNLYYSSTTQVQDYLNWGNKRFLAREVTQKFLFTHGYTPATGKTNLFLGCLTDDENGNYAQGIGAYFIANYKRPAGAYALSPSLLQSRTYKNIGHFVPINESIIAAVRAVDPNGRCVFNNVNVFGGDCFLDYFTYFRLYAMLDQVNNNNQDYNLAMSFPVESEFNIALRQGFTYERFGPTTANVYNDGGTLFPDGLYYFDSIANKIEDFNVNAVLQSESTDTFSYVPKPFSFSEVYDFPVREQYTGTKLYGEEFDTFRKFPVNNFRDADGSKGEINSLQFLFNYLYLVQRNGFARVRFNDRELITGQTGSAIDIGTGLGLQGFDYISAIYGTQHQFSVVNTGRMLHFLDAEKGKHLRFAADGLMSPSDEYGHSIYFKKKLRDYWAVKDPFNTIYPLLSEQQKPYYDNPCYAGGIVGIFDYVNQSVYYTFTKRIESTTTGVKYVGDAETLEYNESSNQYKGFHAFTPKIYFSFKENYLSPDPNSQSSIYAHDEGLVGHIYGVYHNSSIKFTVNPQQVIPKWFDNQSIAINNKDASVKIYQAKLDAADYVQQVVNFPTDTRWRYLQGYLRYPTRGYNAETRLRGKFMNVEIVVQNDTDNQKVRISNVMTDWRVSPKI